MLDKILLTSDLSAASNSIFPYAATVAQAFGSKLYLLNVMHPASLNEPERLEDFPRLSNFFPVERSAPDLPPLKSSVAMAKMYVYHKDVAYVVTKAAREKQIDLICMASTGNSVGLAWWSAGRMIERVIRHAPCSVLCIRGRPVKQKDWKRPRFKHILLLVELSPSGSVPLARVMPL